MADSAGIDSDHLVGDMDLSGEEYRHADGGKDWFSVLLFVVAILALLAAATIAIYALLQRFLPGLRPLFSASASVFTWPFGLETTHVVQIGLLLLALLCYLLGRHRILNNKALQAASGCPACLEHDLVRVRRRKRDRLITASGIRVARYECRNCTWGGLRVFSRQAPQVVQTPYPEPELAENGDVASEAPSSASALAGADQLGEGFSAPASTAVSGPEPLESDATVPEAGDPQHDRPDKTAVETNWVVDDTHLAQEADGGEVDLAIEEVSSLSAPEPTGVSIEAAPGTVAGAREEHVSTAAETSGGTYAKVVTHAKKKKPVLVAGQKARVAASLGLNLRAEPHEGAELVGLLGPDTVVLLLSDVQFADGLAWQQVETRTKRGWVLSSFLRLVE